MAITLTLPPYSRPATPTTPLVALDAQAGSCQVEGRAMPIDASAFFQPILDWIGRYQHVPAVRTLVEFKLDYFNSGTSLQLARFMHGLGQVPNAVVHWYYHPDDEDILEAGQELARMTRVPFQFLPLGE